MLCFGVRLDDGRSRIDCLLNQEVFPRLRLRDERPDSALPSADDAAAELLPSAIHALSIQAKTPDELK